MKTEEKIIKYIDDDLSAEEREVFEKELSASISLQKEYKKLLVVKEEIDLSKNIALDNKYLDSIIPEFRNRVDRPESFTLNKKVGYAFVVIMAFLVSTVIFNNIVTENNKVNDLQIFTESLDEEQKLNLLENLNGDIEEYYLIADNGFSNDLTDLIQTDLEINNDIAEVYGINYNELIDQLSPVEAEKIYNEILRKKF